MTNELLAYVETECSNRGHRCEGELRLLTEAEEERVHTHVVHAEESVSYEVATKGHRLQEHREGGVNKEWKQGHTDTQSNLQ